MLLLVVRRESARVKEVDGRLGVGAEVRGIENAPTLSWTREDVRKPHRVRATKADEVSRLLRFDGRSGVRSSVGRPQAGEWLGVEWWVVGGSER